MCLQIPEKFEKNQFEKLIVRFCYYQPIGKRHFQFQETTNAKDDTVCKLIPIPISWTHGIAYHGFQCDIGNMGKQDKWRTKEGMMGPNSYPQVMFLRNWEKNQERSDTRLEHYYKYKLLGSIC